MKLLEIACFNLESALTARAAGAHRIELCENYSAGGVTPHETLLREVMRGINIPVNVMIRPRPGNFVYNDAEIKAMENSIELCKTMGVHGVVFGVLTNGSELDANLCQHLTALARPLSVTFHRAIDECIDVKFTLQQLVNMGVDRVLTSGRGATAVEGLPELKILQKVFGSKIVIMPGGGVRAANIPQLLASGCSEYHTSAIKNGEQADAIEIKNIVQLLKE